MNSRRLLLVGGGHAHVEVLRRFARRPLPGVRVTLISRQADTPYSGMLPGVIAGHYSRDDSHIALAPLAALAGAEFIVDEVDGLDLAQRLAHRRGGRHVSWDVLSLDIGTTPDTGVARMAPDAIAVKPIDGLLARWDALERTLLQPDGERRLAVIGGGAAGVELVLSMQFRLRSLGIQDGQRRVRLALFAGSPHILPALPEPVRQRFMRVLAARGIDVHLSQRVIAVTGGEVVTAGGRYPADHAVWATQAAAAPWIRESGLAVDDEGFMRVSDTLESLSHADIFGVGDVATIEGQPRPKSGVYAVRQGPPLARNLRARLAGRALERVRLQSRALSLITTGDRYAVAARGRWSVGGRWVWLWKDLIDRRFMRRYRAGT